MPETAGQEPRPSALAPLPGGIETRETLTPTTTSSPASRGDETAASGGKPRRTVSFASGRPQRTESMKAVKQSSLDHEITRQLTAEREDDKGVHGRKKQLGLTRSSSTSLDLPACTVWVGNLPHEVATDAQVSALFSGHFGAVQTVCIPASLVACNARPPR